MESREDTPTSGLFDDTNPVLRIQSRPAKDVFGSSDTEEQLSPHNRRRSSLGSVFVSPIRDKSMNSTPEIQEKKNRKKLLWKSAITSNPTSAVATSSIPPAPTVAERSIATPEPPILDHVKIFLGDDEDEEETFQTRDILNIKCSDKLLPATHSHRPPDVLPNSERPNETFPAPDDSPPIDHIVLVVHGINGSEENLESNLGRFRESIDQVKLLWNLPTLVHVELINWKAAVIGIQSSLFERITPREMSFESRMFINLAISDAAFYLTPSHCDLIQSTVVSLLNDRIRQLIKQYPRKFSNSKISLVGYSLGSVILHDILSSEPTNLDFQVHNLFLWGSPLSAYLSVKDKEYQTGKFILPKKLNIYNIYHPHDPVAFRIEPLYYYLDSETAESELVPYWENNGLLSGKAFQRSIADMRRSIVDQWGGFVAAISGSTNGAGDRPSMLIPKRRLDFVLQESVTENLSHKYSMLTAHYSYWSSRDVALFMIKQLSSDLKIFRKN